MTNDRIFCLWVFTATLAVICTVSCQAGCMASLRLPAVDYASVPIEYAKDVYGNIDACQDVPGERQVWRVEDGY